MPLSPGQILHNRYRIARPIGQGGFGAVYRAWDTSLNQPCAVKENLDTSAEAQRQFYREATLLAAMRHPNLPRVTDHFLIPGQGQYLVMDFIEGQNLGDLVAGRGRPLAEAEVLTWLNQVCDALAYLHSQNPPVIHRDLKPQNIIITPQGQAMLVDFGISKVYDPALRTSTGGRAVTPGYSPPEQYGGSADRTDARSDIYALGATLFAALTGTPPPDAIDRLTQGVALPALATLRPDVSPGLRQVVEGALALSHTQRPASVADLRKLLSGASGQPPAVPLPTVKAGKSAGAQRGNWRLRLGAGVVALIAIAALGLVLSRGGVGPAATPTTAPATTTVAIAATETAPAATARTTATSAVVAVASPTPESAAPPSPTPIPPTAAPTATTPLATTPPTVAAAIPTLRPTRARISPTATPTNVMTAITSAGAAEDTLGAVRALGQPWEQDGASLNAVKAEIRAGEVGEAAARVWFRFFNKSGQKLLVEVDWNDLHMEDSRGVRYVDWSGGEDSFWVETGQSYDFDRYYTIKPGERSRVLPGTESVQVVVRQFSRIKQARWKVNVAATPTPILAPNPAVVKHPGESWLGGGMELLLRDVEIRTGEGPPDAAMRVWFSLVNKSGRRTLVELDYAHLYALDSAGQRFIDWYGGELSSFWLEPAGSYDFERFYTVAAYERGRITRGAEFVLILADRLGPIQNAIWKVDIAR